MSETENLGRIVIRKSESNIPHIEKLEQIYPYEKTESKRVVQAIKDAARYKETLINVKTLQDQLYELTGLIEQTFASEEETAERKKRMNAFIIEFRN